MNRDRDAIARIIDPDGWEKFNGLPANYRGPVVLPPTEALAKADAILALPAGGEVERLREERAQASDAANDWHGKSAYEEDRATRAEAHAERLASALEAFARFHEALQHMGGNFPKTGPFHAIESSVTGPREITVEDYAEARQALSAYNQRTET